MKTIQPVLLALPLLTLLAFAPARAADPIATDRPDFVESSNVVGHGRLQVETSLAAERNSLDGVRDRSVATPTLLRYGISDTLELRLESDGRVRGRSTDSSGVTRFNGSADASVGMKWHATDGGGSAPSVGVLVHADLDSGSKDLRGSGVRPSVRVVGEWELPSDYSLGVMPGVSYEKNDAGDRFVNGIFGIVVGKTLSERLRSFAELSLPQIASRKNGGTQASLNTGVAYLINDNCQIDAAVSKGLNHRTADLGVTVGLSFKL